MKGFLSHLESVVCSLAFPLYCPSCGGDFQDGTGWFCPFCWSNLPVPGKGQWSRFRTLKECVHVSFRYFDPTRLLIHQMKYNGRIDIAREIGVRMADRFSELVSTCGATGIVPVPLHPVRVRERGFDQNLHIARSLAQQFDLPLFTRLIKRIRNTPPQSRLSDAERLTNLRGAFSPYKDCVPPPEGTILLVDDVIHTGATALGCIEALAETGIREVIVLAAFG